ncbi:hypothetical protein FB45DRAFT_222619 [Roridomyces roridus]|uniref:DUF6534 domain-containing protein n=1 Tax=Roridomyces roridus TaxID=1738132 RepID=A0AAD7BC84_9AGAR|nr:hypothetical protein FB45DRAFT_222619 [Roridomyces roridus]
MPSSPPPEAAAAAPPAPDVTLLFGPLLLGVLLNTLLYGVFLVQAFMYYHRYRKDRPWFRYLVLYLLIMETVNWVCDIGLIYEPLIVRYATPQALITSPVMLRPDAVLTVLISTPIQLFIAWRVRVVTNSRILPAFISLFALISLGGGASVTTIVTLHPDFSQFSQFHPEVITWLVSSAACDVMLTGSLVFSLWIRKGNVMSTDSYLNKIIRLTVQTGAITATGSLADVILYIALPNSTMNFLIDFPLSKLYSNSLISTLNARPWREETSQHDAPNVLFERTTNGTITSHGQTTFNLSARRSYYVRVLRFFSSGSLTRSLAPCAVCSC